MLIVLIILLLQNKEFFIWCSLLVEAGYFSNITVGFLIVGHTHASIDQYFSCLRRKIRNASFIGSPIALQYLFSLPSTTEDEKKNKSLYRPPHFSDTALLCTGLQISICSVLQSQDC